MINDQALENHAPVYLDMDFGIAAISELSHRERAAFKPVYSMNKWWARRSSSVFRAILLGLALPPEADLMNEFYSNHQKDPQIKDKLILDPFMGGGTTVVEALRLGYKAIGVDLNPFSWFIVKTETTAVDLKALQEAYERVEEEVASSIRSMYVTRCPCCESEAEVIYAFWAKVAKCTDPECRLEVPLFRDYIVGKRRGETPIRYHEVDCPSCGTKFDAELDRADLIHNHLTKTSMMPQSEIEEDGRPWSFCGELGEAQCPKCSNKFHWLSQETTPSIKKVSLYALLCPQCRSVFSHRGEVPDQVECPSCALRYNPNKGTTDSGTFICPEGHESTITDAVARREDGQPLDFQLYALEGFCPHCAEKKVRNYQAQPALPGFPARLPRQVKASVCPDCKVVNHKFFKQPGSKDLLLYERAVQEWNESKDELPWPKDPIQDYEKTNRLVIHNYRFWYQLFNPRQLLALTKILKSILAEPDNTLKETLLSAFLGTLEHQNMLNIYHVPYAQSAGAFGRHDFHPKVMACEGNPWGSQKGRGPFILAYQTVVEGKKYLVDPYDAQYTNGERKDIFTGEAFSGQQAAEFTELVEGYKNLLLKIKDSRNLHFIPSASVDHVVTDPPYADSVQYAELSDFFYVWLRKALENDYPGLFTEPETPKEHELVENIRRRKSQADFYRGLKAVFTECYRVLKPSGRMVFTFHHNKRSQWINLLEALLGAGFVLVEVYPVKSEATESGNLVFHSNANSVAYDIIHVCQKAVNRAENGHQVVKWDALKSRIILKVKKHIEAIKAREAYVPRIADGDVRVMLWGECLSMYSQYFGKVMNAKEEPVDIATALMEAATLVEEILAAQGPQASDV